LRRETGTVVGLLPGKKIRRPAAGIRAALFNPQTVFGEVGYGKTPLLAHYGNEGKPEPVIPKFSQNTLANMVENMRSRVSFLLNKFRKLGFIHYNGRIEVHSSLLNIDFHD